MLTPKQSLFVKEYLVDLNGKQAAIRAGYEFKSVPATGYYVYFLANPDTGKIFYVGKGTKKRISKHVKDAQKGLIDNVGKFQAIKEVLKTGKKPVELVFDVNKDEFKMYALEHSLIKEFRKFGLENISSGFKDNRRIDIERSKALLSRLKTFAEWDASAPKGARDWAIKAYGSMERAYTMFRVEVLNNIIHIERQLNT